MLLLVTKAEVTLMRHAHPNLGRLVQPRHYTAMRDTITNRTEWAADNDCYQGLDPDAYRTMIQSLPYGARFVTVPDVVGDHTATSRRWRRWAPYVRRLGHPAAFVLQDGCHSWRDVPTDADAVFVGGTTRYKLSAAAARIVNEANTAGLWTHMGRVNTRRRIRYAKTIGCNSVDGTSFSKFTDTHLGWALTECAAPIQTAIEMDT